MVCKLNKALHGLKQSPRTSYLRLDLFLQSISFTKSIADTNLYIKFINTKFVILAIYVNDTLLITNDSSGLLQEVELALSTEF